MKKATLIGGAAYLSAALLIFISFRCATCLYNWHIQKLRQVTLFSSLPLDAKDGKMVTLTGQMELIELDDINVYRVPIFQVQNDGKDSRSVNDTSYQYFVYETGQSTGFRYDSLTAETGKEINMDSFLSQNSILDAEPFLRKNRFNGKLIRSTWNNDSNRLVEYYLPLTRPDDSYADTTILTYDRALDDYHFSLSKEQERQKGIPLAGIRMVYAANKNASVPAYQLSRTIEFSLQARPVFDTKAVLKLIARYHEQAETGSFRTGNH